MEERKKIMYSNQEIEKIIMFLNGHLTAEQEREFKNQLRSDAQYHKLFIEISSYFKTSLNSNIKFNTNKALKKVNRKIHSTRTLYLKLAATAAIFILGFLLIQNVTETSSTIQYYSNTSAEPKEIMLSDGSKLILNTNATVEYLKEFSSSKRELKLQGEAFFRVAKDKDRPFIISLDGAQVQVLGTSFNIKERGKQILLSVQSGKVLFKSNFSKESLILTKNQSASIFKGETGIKKNVDFDSNYNSWITGILKFKNSKLNKVCKSLENFYNKNIVIKNQADTNLILNSNFKNQKLEEVIELIEFALDTDLEIK